MHVFTKMHLYSCKKMPLLLKLLRSAHHYAMGQWIQWEECNYRELFKERDRYFLFIEQAVVFCLARHIRLKRATNVLYELTYYYISVECSCIRLISVLYTKYLRSHLIFFLSLSSFLKSESKKSDILYNALILVQCSMCSKVGFTCTKQELLFLLLLLRALSELSQRELYKMQG